jgi:site-specific recombinase XerD
MPDVLLSVFLRYLSNVRPRFRHSNDHEFVWCSMKRGRLHGDSIYQAIRRRTLAAFGHAIHPHLFRDIAVTSMAMDRPEQIRLAKDPLGHGSFELTERHYLHAQSMKAGKHLGDVIRAIRTEPTGGSA